MRSAIAPAASPSRPATTNVLIMPRRVSCESAANDKELDGHPYFNNP